MSLLNRTGPTKTRAAARELVPRPLRALGVQLALLVVAALVLLAAVPASGADQATYDLMVSQSSNRGNASALASASVSGNIYVFVLPEAGVKKVEFYLDDPNRAGQPRLIEGAAPWDFAGTATNKAFAKPFDTRTIADGSHTITAAMTETSGAVVVKSATFTVLNSPPTLSFSAASLSLPVDRGSAPTTSTVDLGVTNSSSAQFTVADDATWLSVSPSSGEAPASLSVQVDPAGLAPGRYTATISASAPGHTGDTLPVTLTVHELYISLTPERTSPIPLAGETVGGKAYIFAAPAVGPTKTSFYLDDPDRTGSPRQIEVGAPYDFAGTATDGRAKPFDTATLANGFHTVTVAYDLPGGTTHVKSATFKVTNPPPTLVFSPASLSASIDDGGATVQQVGLATNDGASVAYTVSDDAAWLSASGGAGTPDSVVLNIDGTGLATGTYSATVVATAAGYRSASLPVKLRVGCPPLTCADVLVDLPYQLDWSESHGMIADGAGVGTGFTHIDTPSFAPGYLPEKLAVDTAASTLDITTTSGAFTGTTNTQANALAVGVDAASQGLTLTTTLVDPPLGTGKFEQAGIWFGNGEDNYVKLVVLSTTEGLKFEHYVEVNGANTVKRSSSAVDLAGKRALLKLRTNPYTQTVSGSYRVGTGPETSIGTFDIPGEFFSFDGARINPKIGTDSFAGVFATHRNASTPLTYRFDNFAAAIDDAAVAPPPADGIAFDRSSFPIDSPTSMALGPDGRLYVTELFGRIHAVTLDEAGNLVADEVVTSIGMRLTLGITVDPLSTADNVILWVSHSSPSLDNGAANSSTITRLSGSGFATRQDVITGLPRAKANHAVNSIHFGPDGKLYIAAGGNTGAGARDTDPNSEFGDRGEQPLSAAILTADVRDPNFDGSCANATDIYGPPPCDVEVYASGLRNTYDFVFHSNGSMYAPDNGLGVGAVYPPSPNAPCTGFGTVDPGGQPDKLNRILPGKYYGHPNPTRNECVFMDGSHQGVAPLPNYVAPIHVLGDHRSANGTVEYTGNGFCGELRGSVLMTNYSLGDDITRVSFSADGTSVTAAGTLVGGFNDPLPIATDATGRIWVGELSAGKVTVLRPADLGCWTTHASVADQLLDAGGAALGDKLYVVGGKTSGGPHSRVYVYTPASDSWSQAANLPGAAVENPAVVAEDGKLYVFGGSTLPFSGAVTNAAVFNPATGAWTSLPPMPNARGGATAKALAGKIYVAGGMDASGASQATVDVYDLASGSWSSAAPMSTRRDNAGSAVLNGKLYVFGGRTRNADGSTVNGTLATVEMYDAGTGTWADRTSMPTGRRTMVVGTLNGRAQVMGGEITTSGGAFAQNEEYDPSTDTWRSLKPMKTGRHGAAAGTIGDTVYVVGGGSVGGSSFTSVNESFSFSAP